MSCNVSEILKIWSILFILLLFTHMKMKKMLLGAFLGMFTLAGIAVLPNYASATNWADPDGEANLVGNDQKLTWSAFLDTLKNAVNWLLGILATIALVFCLYGWFLMVTSAWDEKKYSSWLNVLKYAGIGLAIIGLSWMIVSVIFWFVGTLWKWNQTQGEQQWDVDSTTYEGTSIYGSGGYSGDNGGDKGGA